MPVLSLQMLDPRPRQRLFNEVLAIISDEIWICIFRRGIKEILKVDVDYVSAGYGDRLKPNSGLLEGSDTLGTLFTRGVAFLLSVQRGLE
jgi:hypothetical protein